MSETRSVEATGADIEEAILAGLAQLQVSRASVIVEIITEPSRGLLGLGSKQAVVRLTTAARPQSEFKPSFETEAEAESEAPEPSKPADISPAPKAKKPEKAAPTGTAGQFFTQATPIAEEAYTEEVRLGKAVLETFLGLMTISAQVEVEMLTDEENGEETYVLQVRGDDLSLLIGRHGESLAALQYLTRLVASRDLQQRASFVVDVSEYKANRAAKLYQLAHRMADQAVERGRMVKLEPMPPHERRIIHLALRNRTDVTTNSIDEGRYRKVTILPKND